MKTLVVLPTYNESATVAEVLRRIRASATHTIDVLVVDDNSPDGTADIAQALADELGGIDVCCHLGGGTGPSLGTAALVELDEDAWDRCVQRNLVSPWLVASRSMIRLRVQATRSRRRGPIGRLSSSISGSSAEGPSAFR